MIALLDGYPDDCLLGWASLDDGQTVAVYSGDAIVRVLVERDGMDFEGACEFVEFNVEHAGPGPIPSPLLVWAADRERIELMAEDEDDER